MQRSKEHCDPRIHLGDEDMVVIGKRGITGGTKAFQFSHHDRDKDPATSH